MKQKTIGIISLGLIGGSILKTLSKTDNKIIAVTRNKTAIKNAKKYTKYVSDKINSLKDCDIVFVCSPMNKTLDILKSLEGILNPQTIVTDVCSLKEFVMKEEFSFKFIGSHPMAGTENNGFSASFEELFKDAKWVITPKENTLKKDINALSKIIKLTGAKVITTTPKEHDEAVALISHMPMLIAQALMKTALPNDLAIKLASSGFRDMTRLALSNTEMAEDMIKMNHQNISKSLISLIESSRELLNDDYKKQIESIKDFRLGMYNKNGKNISN